MKKRSEFVTLDYCNKSKKFKCYIDGMETEVATLNDGDEFNLVTMGNVFPGNIKSDGKLYSFTSKSGQYDCELAEGMSGIVEFEWH